MGNQLTIGLIVLFALATGCYLTHGMTHPTYGDKDFVQAIVGEAADQTEDTMICIAYALRNRGTVDGVYGYHAPHVWEENDYTWANAWQAWYTSTEKNNDPVRGACNFGTIMDSNIESRIDLKGRFHGTARCGDFYFY